MSRKREAYGVRRQSPKGGDAAFDSAANFLADACFSTEHHDDEQPFLFEN